MKDVYKKTITLFNSKEECCGCSACVAICPREAISMFQDDEGFYYPKIIEEKCIQCGLCMQVCCFK